MTKACGEGLSCLKVFSKVECMNSGVCTWSLSLIFHTMSFSKEFTPVKVLC